MIYFSSFNYFYYILKIKFQEHYDERMLSAKCGPTHLRLKIEDEDLPMVPDWHTKVVDYS